MAAGLAEPKFGCTPLPDVYDVKCAIGDAGSGAWPEARVVLRDRVLAFPTSISPTRIKAEYDQVVERASQVSG
jgi:hypothetical protein